jgi:hypothetical protein
MTCSECTLVQWCGRVTDPRRTGRPCPHFKQWTSRLERWLKWATCDAQCKDCTDGGTEQPVCEDAVPAWLQAMEEGADEYPSYMRGVS